MTHFWVISCVVKVKSGQDSGKKIEVIVCQSARHVFKAFCMDPFSLEGLQSSPVLCGDEVMTRSLEVSRSLDLHHISRLIPAVFL